MGFGCSGKEGPRDQKQMQACHYLLRNRKMGHVGEHMKSTVEIGQYYPTLFIKISEIYKSYTFYLIAKSQD